MSPALRVGLRAGALAILLLAAARSARAQTHSTALVPIGSTLDEAALWAAGSGALPGLDPQVRPFRYAALRDAVASADTTVSARATAVRRLRQAMEDADSATLAAEAGVASYTNGRRDSFRPGGRGGSALALGVRGAVARGPFSAVVNPAIDNRLKDDPEFTGYTGRAIAGRLQEGYIAVDGRIGTLVLGRFARQWGPEPFDGLLVSTVAYPVDGISGSLRVGRLELQSFTERLNDADSTAAVAYQRWHFAHRLGIRLGRAAHLGLFETGVYGGIGGGFDPVLSSPVGLALLGEYDDHRRVNSQLGVDATLPLGSATFAGSGFLDDIQLDHSTLTDRRPASYGLTLTLRYALPSAPIQLVAGYTRVSALAYRNSDTALEYSLVEVGLGRNFSDYDQWLLRAEWRPSGRVDVRLDLSWIRQGSGDFRQPLPPDSILAQPGQGFLVAPVYRAPGARLSAVGELAAGVRWQAEVGATRTATGASAGIARIALRLGYDFLNRRLGGVQALY